MHLMVKFILLVLQVCAIASSVVFQGSSGEKLSSLQANVYAVPPITEGSPHRVTQEEQMTSNSPSPTSQPNSSPHFDSAPRPQVVKPLEPSLSPNTPLNEPPHVIDPVSPPVPAAPISLPSEGSPPNPPIIQPTIPVSVPPIPQQEKGHDVSSPVYPPVVSVQIAPPPKEVMQNPPPVPQVPPSMPQGPPFIILGPVASPPSKLPIESPPIFPTLHVPPPSNILGPVASPTLPIAPPNLPVPVALPPITLPRSSPPSPPMPLPVPMASPPRNSAPSPPTSTVPPPATVASPPSNLPKNIQPIQHNSSIPPSNLPEPHVSPVSTPLPSINRVPVSSPPNRTTNIAPAHHSPVKAPPPPTKTHPSPSLPPLYPPSPPGPKRKPWHYAPPPPPIPVPLFDTVISPAISPSTTSPYAKTTIPFISPKISPWRSSPRIRKMPIQALPPPPPNEDCLSITCKEPLTNTPPGTPCNCVLPMQIELELSVALYTFFPLVSELALEIASGVFMKSSQVRIMGANADNQDSEKTIVIVDLVPLGQTFDSFTAYLTAQRLWMKQVAIKSSLFGDYQVLYVKYPGLPPSPPLPFSSTGTNGEPYGHGNDARAVKPLGINVIKQRHRSNKLNGGILAIIVLSAVVAVVLFGVMVWVLMFKRRDRSRFDPTPRATLPSLMKSSGSGHMSTSMSFGSSIAYTGSAKTFSSSDIEKITDNFNEAGVLGEGGFGRVYSGVLDGGTKVAVKVLKRDDQQGGREFLAEVEMLSRLHHRNLVRLIGICTEERNRCLVYELIPNGSVESHLHGIDKGTAGLDWGARLKIALGAARGLAYLHEDSSPRVIHRDFKSSNILLEHDFTPKVSDFGLARTALDEENTHISTRVMGTFGYVAPEYAMTGHLLVKSDVYSYGVVLLELLTGRKPVDMSMPPGQENLVVWARLLLLNPEDLNLLVDPSLWSNGPVDSIAKVAAIASMCVQPEVSHRPFMGEVVQALKLVCEETRDLGSTTCSQDDLTSVDFDFRDSTNLGPDRPMVDMESGFSGSDLGLDPGSYRMGSSSGPLRAGRRVQLWERMKRFSGGSASEHGDFLRLMSRSR